jgi:pimeloyl-ACP methyl ester carboxylesterase
MTFPAPRIAFAEVRGLRLEYLEWGSGDEVLICLHGTSMHAWAWSHLAGALLDRYRVIALNLRGHGESDRPAEGYAIRDYRDDVIAFAKALGIERYALAGSSLGTQVAIAVAAAAPQNVRGLLLSDPSCTITQASIDRYVPLHKSRPRRFASFAEASAYARALPQRSGLSEALHEVTEHGDFRQLADGQWEWRYDLSAILQTFDGLRVDQWDEVRATRCPVLILRGEHSHVLSLENAQRLKETFPLAELIEVRNSSHTIWGDQPELLAQLARVFLAFAPRP